MALACQQDSFLKELTTTVKSCQESELVLTNGKQQEKLRGYDVTLEDTVLFPEGGGQPDDRGTINGIDVLRVTRKGALAVHFVKSPLDVGLTAVVKVDWQRRFDHMQQHSGQHLVTALADKLFGAKTTSWSLGATVSSIELDVPTLSAEQMEQLEGAVNEAIRSALPMTPSLYDSTDAPELAQVRARGLPDDHVGPVRVVTIQGIDANMCCGTHVTNLSQLQAIKLLYVEPWKPRIRLAFVAGNRLLKYFGGCYENERVLNALLSCRPDEYVTMIKKIQESARTSSKKVVQLLRDLAVTEAGRVRATLLNSAGDQEEGTKFVSYHRDEGDNDFMNLFVNEVNDPGCLVFVSVGETGSPGSFLLSGPEQLVQELGPKVSAVMEGKGGGRGSRYQGKTNKLVNRSKAEDLLRASVAAQVSRSA